MLVCVGGQINCLISVRSPGNGGQEAVIYSLYSHDLKTKISFSAIDQMLIFTISILEEKCTCCVGFFFPQQHLLRTWNIAAHVVNAF